MLLKFIEILKVVLIGIVEGISEWLPISSSGHMLLLDEFIHLNIEDNFKGCLKVCSVVGFPLGATATNIKCEEIKTAIEDGADELDVVINIGRIKAGDYEYAKNELIKIRKAF